MIVLCHSLGLLPELLFASATWLPVPVPGGYCVSWVLSIFDFYSWFLCGRFIIDFSSTPSRSFLFPLDSGAKADLCLSLRITREIHSHVMTFYSISRVMRTHCGVNNWLWYNETLKNTTTACTCHILQWSRNKRTGVRKTDGSPSQEALKGVSGVP